MNARTRLSRIRSKSDERGAALTMVIVIGAVLMMLIATGTAFSLSSLRKSSTDADWNGAMAAAYAGVEDYKSKLSNDNAYVKYGNKFALFSSGSDLQLPTGVMTNPAFGLGTAGSWASGGTPWDGGSVPTWRF